VGEAAAPPESVLRVTNPEAGQIFIAVRRDSPSLLVISFPVRVRLVRSGCCSDHALIRKAVWRAADSDFPLYMFMNTSTPLLVLMGAVRCSNAIAQHVLIQCQHLHSAQSGVHTSASVMHFLQWLHISQ